MCDDPLQLLESTDPDYLLAVQALTEKAFEYRELLDDRLAAKIINRLAAALDG